MESQSRAICPAPSNEDHPRRRRRGKRHPIVGRESAQMETRPCTGRYVLLMHFPRFVRLPIAVTSPLAHGRSGDSGPPMVRVTKRKCRGGIGRKAPAQSVWGASRSVCRRRSDRSGVVRETCASLSVFSHVRHRGVLIPAQVVVRHLRGYKASWKFACSDGGMSSATAIRPFPRSCITFLLILTEGTKGNERDGRIRRGAN